MRRHLRPTLSVICGALLAASGQGHGQPPSAQDLPLTLPSPRFHRYSTDNGLPQNSVRCIVQTRDGFLWATTFDGLVRFDGVAFKVFDAGNTPGLSGNRFVTLCAGDDDSLWIGDESRRVFRLKDGRAVAWNEADQLPAIPHVRRHRSGRMLAFAGGRTFELGEGGGLRPAGELPLARELATAGSAPSFAAWLLGSTVITFEDGELRQVPLPEEALTRTQAGKGAVFSVYTSTDGGLYVISWSGSLHRHQRGVWERLPSLSEMTGGRIAQPAANPRVEPEGWPALRDRMGRVWLSVPGQGLFRRDAGGRRTVRYGARDGFTSVWDRPYLFEDRHGTLWVGTDDAGLLRFKGDLVTSLSTFDGLPINNVNSVLEDRSGTIWAAASGGPLSRVTGASVERVTLPGLDGKFTIQTALHEDSRGRVLIGTGNGGLFRYEGGRYEELTGSGPVGEMVVDVMCEEPDGTLWLGGEGKLAAWKPDGTWRTYGLADGLPSVRVRALVPARGGGLWIATWGGLARLRDGRFTAWRARDGLASDHLRSLHEEPDGTLWIGTYDRGLTRFRHGRFASVTAGEGLPSNGVFAILPDDFGRFWMSSNVGVASVSRSELHAVADGRIRRVTAVLYTREDGMLASECNGGKQPAGFRTRDGRLLFGSQGGIVVVDPSARPPSPEPERILIEAVLSRGAPRPFRPALEVRPGEDEFEIRYTAPAFVKPELIRFQYRLAGLTDSWTDAGTRRAAFFSFVPPGSYTFEVRATSVDGVVSPQPARLPIAVFAPWWKTPPAVAFLGLLLAGIAALAVRLRIRALRRRGEELEALVASRTDELASKARQLEQAVDRLTTSEREALQASQAKSVFLASMSHELRTPLNAVLGFAQLMERRQDRTDDDRESLEIIRRSGEHLLGLINDVLSLAKIEAGKATLTEAPFGLHRMLLSVRDMVRVRTDAKSLRLDFELGPDVPAFVAGDEGKLRQVLLNLLGNAVKFTQSGTVALRVQRRRERVRFEVTDTGQGIAPEEIGLLFGAFSQTASGRGAAEGTGLGLAISRNLVRLMGGDIEVESEPGKGSVFAFDLALAEASAPAEAPVRSTVTRLAPDQPPFRILVADDVLENRRLLAKLLMSVGFEVVQASDGEQALAAIRERRPHLALMDVRMPGSAAAKPPGLNGREVTRIVRGLEDAPSGRCLVVGLSAGVLEDERQAFLAAGGDDFIGKPFREEEIFEVLERLLGARFERRAPAPERAGASAAEALSSEALGALPAAVLRQLEAAVSAGDLERARTLAEGLRSKHSRVADAVLDLLDRFEIARLLGLLERAREGSVVAPR